jgi:hypothetical protein
MSPDDTYCRTDELPYRTLDGETVVVNPQRREVHVLNGTGSRIWDLLSPARTVADLVRTLQGEFEVDPAEAQAQVATFMGHLVDRGLVRVSRRDDS